MQIYPKGHVCDRAINEIIDIQKPLHKIEGLHLLLYGCYYTDNTGYSFYTNKPFWVIRTSLNIPFQGTYKQSGIYPWSDFHSTSFIKIAEDFNIFTPVNLIFPLPEGKGQEIFTFAFHQKDNPGVTFYLNNLDFLNKFVEHFRMAASTLINEAYKTRITVPAQFVKSLEAEPSYHKMIDSLVANFTIPVEFTDKANLLHQLTDKEILCLCYYLMGKTAAEIAVIFDISPKTASAHLYNARLKLKCKNRSELFQKAIEAGLTHSDLMEYLTQKK